MRIRIAFLTALALAGVLLVRGRAADEDRPAGRFDVHQTCARCHDETQRGSAMRDAAGRNVAPVDLWRSSAMANASRDPLWLAVVAIETAATPSRSAEIEALCMRCHAPMAPLPRRLGDLEAHERAGDLARDGVSCTVCHGITAQGLGTEASFGGAWVLDGKERLYGPHRNPFARPMRVHSGFQPTAAGHVLEPALCGTCHTLFTRALDEAGEETGDVLAEQTPYLEWRNSHYSTETELPWPEAATCQDCHMPTTDLDGAEIQTRIAHNPGGRDFPPTRARTPFGRHTLVGGNALLPRLLRGGGSAPPEAFDATQRRVSEQLRSAAELELVHLAAGREGVEVDVRISNRTGHRLPTAHPTRRVWLALEILDADGRVAFTSGAVDAEGRLVGADGAPLPSELAGGPLPRHVEHVENAGTVAMYDARMEDAEGRATWLLTRGVRFAKDDRLLPAGWREDGPHAALTRPVGTEHDADFAAGGDVVRYRLALGKLAGHPFTVRARLLHQTVGARWAAELGLDVPLPVSEIARLEVRVGP